MYVTRKGLERSRKVREAKMKVLSRELDEINEALEKLSSKGKKK